MGMVAAATFQEQLPRRQQQQDHQQYYYGQKNEQSKKDISATEPPCQGFGFLLHSYFSKVLSFFQLYEMAGALGNIRDG